MNGLEFFIIGGICLAIGFVLGRKYEADLSSSMYEPDKEAALPSSECIEKVDQLFRGGYISKKRALDELGYDPEVILKELEEETERLKNP